MSFSSVPRFNPSGFGMVAALALVVVSPREIGIDGWYHGGGLSSSGNLACGVPKYSWLLVRAIG